MLRCRPRATTPERKPRDASSPLQIDRRCGRHPGGSPPWNRCMIVIWIRLLSTRRDRRALLLLSCAAPVPAQELLRGNKAGIGDEAAPDAAGGGCRDEALHMELAWFGWSLCGCVRSIRSPLAYFGFCNVTP